MTERKIALYDIDGTSYKGLLVLDLVRYQLEKGTLPKNTFNNIENNINLYRQKQLGYEVMAQHVLEYWAEGLKGKNVSSIEEETRSFFKTPEGNKFLPFVQESINLFRSTHGAYFLTAEPQFVAQEVTTIHKASGYLSTIFEVENGLFTGRVTSSLATRKDKGNIIKPLLQKHGKDQSFAFGDSDGDIEMLEGVEYPICVNPNDALTKTATERDWAIKKPEEIIIYIREVLTKPKP